MTVGKTEEICVRPRKEASEGVMKRPLTFTALSTIAVQSGKTQIVVSILKSGSSVHLQLVHVEPGLCEIGTDQEENHNLLQEQKYLLEKLKKHEVAVLSSVDKKRVEQHKQWKEDSLCEQRTAKEDQEGVYRAMECSLKEGWTLLLRLLDRRLHTLKLTADFYHTVKEFALGIERLEDLQIKPGRLNDAQLTYISIRRDLLGKSLQLLAISSDLVRKLRELQKSEALQRQGEVLQEEDDEDQESSQCSWGTVLRLEQVVEALQDRRRAVDLEVKLQIQQAQNNVQTYFGEQGTVERQEWSLEEILAYKLSSTPEAESDHLKPEEARISPEKPPVSSNSTEINDNKFTSNSSLMSSNEILDLQTAFELEEEQQLRVESRNREQTPTCGCEETEGNADEDRTSRTSLETLSEEEDLTQELELEEFENFEAEKELQNLKSESIEHFIQSGLHINSPAEIKLDQYVKDVFIEKESDQTLNVRSPSNDERNRWSGTKLELREKSLPIFNLVPVQLHSESKETTNHLPASPKFCKSNEETPVDHAEKSIIHELNVAENKNLQQGHIDENYLNLDAKLHSQYQDSKLVHIESSQNEMDNHDEINIHEQAQTSKVKQSLQENCMTLSASKSGPLAKLEHCSRSLPIFNLVPKKLQPRLQDTKDLLNITTNKTSKRFEETIGRKHLEISNMQHEASSDCNGYTEPNDWYVVEEVETPRVFEPENVPELDNGPKFEDNKELHISASLNDIANSVVIEHETKDVSNERSASVTSLKCEVTAVDQEDGPVKKSEPFSERFKKLQSKWQEKQDVTLKLQNRPYKVKNLNTVVSSKSKKRLNEALISDKVPKWDMNDIVNIQYNTEDNNTVMPLAKTEDDDVETAVKAESTTAEECELMLDNSTSELMQEEARLRQIEEIEKLHASCDQLADKVCAWLDHCTCELSVSSHPGHCLSEVQLILNLNIQLQSDSQAIGEDAESMGQILDQLQALSTDSGDDYSVSSLRCAVKAELTARVDIIMKHLNTVNTTIQFNLQLLQPYVSFLQMAEEAKRELEHLKQVYSKKTEMEERMEETKWQSAEQKLLMTQKLGNYFNNDLCQVMEGGVHLESVAHVVMETTENLNKTKEEAEELRKYYQMQMQKLRDDKEYCLKYRERLEKTVKNLQCVSELIDSCTVIDLGSEQHTSRLLQQFTLARPHFTQLDAEASFITSNFETLRRLQKRHGLLITETVTEEDVSALLDLHLRLKQKIEESESILELSSSFHLIIKKMEESLHSKPTLQGKSAEEKLNLLKVEKDKIHNLFNRASNLKMDICDGVRNSSVCGLQVQQLEAYLLSVDSQRLTWLREAARCEEDILKEMKSQALLHDIHLLRDSFKDLKKRFSNLKINYLKRNDRSRNIKAVRNQLQQVDSYEDKLQSMKSRLQALTARLQLEVKDGGSSRELEDLLNELHRQMGECERSIKEHHKTLDMTCSLQEAMDEYQMWCEEATGTIARVGKFSTECCSTEAVTALYRQFEKFVWPTVPQQEERISQITELAVRLHGADEGQKYIEKTVSKHSEMVTAIRALSDGLLELEAKLKFESLKQLQNDEEQVKTEDGWMEKVIKEKDIRNTSNGIKDAEKSKQQQVDNRTAQETAEMYELKETGHTPELTNKHDGKDISGRRHSISKKPPLQKHRTQETDRQASSSFCSTHSFSLSCSPLDTNRQVYAILSQSQSATSQATPTEAPPSSGEVHKSKRDDTQDTVEGGLCETELHHHPEVLSEDSLSTDEYECPSPDDISLPPLAETPESILVQSDLEEGLCFGSQHSYRSHVQSEHRESRETNQQSVSRYRTESGTFVPSPMTVPISSQVQAEFTTTVHMVTTEETTIKPEQSSHDHIPEQPSRNLESIPPIHTNKNMNPSVDITFPKSSISVSEEISNINPDSGILQSFPVCQSSIHQDVSSFETICISSHKIESMDCNKSQSDQTLKDKLADVKLPKQEFPNFSPCNNNSMSTNSLTENCQQIESILCHESGKCGKGPNSTEEETVKLIQRAACNSLTTTFIKETVYSKSTMSSSSLVQIASSPTPEKDNLIGVDSPHQDEIDVLESTGKNVKDIPGKDCEDEMDKQNTDFKHAPSSNSFDDTNTTQEHFGDSTKESDSINPSNPSCNATSNTSNTINIKQNHQTVYHETSSEQSLHDPGFSAQPSPCTLLEAKTQALPQQPNTHATPRYTSPHLLTIEQDPDICQPCTIREEIRLTRQIKGPSVPPQGQEECSSFTRPLSKAAVMGGSPVTLEVEVTGQDKPTLTWCKDDIEEEEQVRVENQRYEEVKAMDGAVCEAWLAAAGENKHSSDDEGEDRGLMAEIYDIMMADWQTWFGTLCFLLWLLILIIL